MTRGIECVYRTSKRTGRPSAQTNADGKLRPYRRWKPSTEPRIDSATVDDNCASSTSPMLEKAPGNVSTTTTTCQLDVGLAEVSAQSSPGFLEDSMNQEDSTEPAWNFLQNVSDEQGCHHESGCLNSALNLLGQSSLAYASTAVVRPTNSRKEAPPITLEAAISLNKELTGPLTSILNCSCAPNENLLTVVALVISRILTWCTRAVDNTEPTKSNCSSASSMSDSEFSPMDLLDPSQTSSLPCMSNGDYGVDAMSLIAAETMLDDLYRLNVIIERFSRHVEVVTGGVNATNCSEEAGQSRSIHMSTSSDSLLLSDIMVARAHVGFRRRLRIISLKVAQILIRG
jgi:hypothetical protein